ncbi:Hypothetical predicted protein [Octopus vulgaris]|uniref:Uncharacterized protein n=1 Tax=Octopus vulgaris TaxID=6645 RepID=A0AA36BJX8_OCTVU|nr:Hypothetical predicted protein [Octopus vulgaris]
MHMGEGGRGGGEGAGEEKEVEEEAVLDKFIPRYSRELRKLLSPFVRIPKKIPRSFPSAPHYSCDTRQNFFQRRHKFVSKNTINKNVSKTGPMCGNFTQFSFVADANFPCRGGLHTCLRSTSSIEIRKKSRNQKIKDKTLYHHVRNNIQQKQQ